MAVMTLLIRFIIRFAGLQFQKLPAKILDNLSHFVVFNLEKLNKISMKS